MVVTVVRTEIRDSGAWNSCGIDGIQPRLGALSGDMTVRALGYVPCEEGVCVCVCVGVLLWMEGTKTRRPLGDFFPRAEPVALCF